MSIFIDCHVCGRTHEIPDRFAGRAGRCGCGTRIPVPMPGSAKVDHKDSNHDGRLLDPTTRWVPMKPVPEAQLARDPTVRVVEEANGQGAYSAEVDTDTQIERALGIATYRVHGRRLDNGHHGVAAVKSSNETDAIIKASETLVEITRVDRLAPGEEKLTRTYRVHGKRLDNGKPGVATIQTDSATSAALAASRTMSHITRICQNSRAANRRAPQS